MFWAVRSLTSSLKQACCSLSVFSTEDQFTKEDAKHWEGIGLEVFQNWGPTAFRYAPRVLQALHGADLDVLHTHGLWMYPSIAATQWASRGSKPLLVSPHGMLDPWALGNAAWKKRVAGWLYENRHLRRASCLHALNDAEYRAIRAYGLRNPVAIIPNGVDLPDPGTVPPRPTWADDLPDGSRVLLFLGRLHPKKGLVELLHGWARARKRAPATLEGWRLVIAGWDQGGHESVLQALSRELGLSDCVRFIGPQFDEKKSASLAHADAFVLPSHSEGLPMAVLEAWANRLPVLMTPQCNLPEELASGAAIAADPEPVSLAEGLVHLCGLSQAERQTMAGHGRKVVATSYTWPSVAVRMREVYAWALGDGPRPETVRFNGCTTYNASE